MDPNTTLARLRELAAAADDVEEAAELAEAFHALDEWLSRGGFLPADWARHPANRPPGRNPRPIF